MVSVRVVRSTFAFLAAAAALALGCSAAPDGSGEVSVGVENTGSSTESLTRFIIPAQKNGYVEPDWKSLGCDPSVNCCYPATGGRAFDTTNKFEADLKADGCTTPVAYAQNITNHQWWFLTQCPTYSSTGTLQGGVNYSTQSLIPGPLTSEVVDTSSGSPPGYSNVAPIYSHFPALGMPCISSYIKGYSMVLWDPNCPGGCSGTTYQ